MTEHATISLWKREALLHLQEGDPHASLELTNADELLSYIIHIVHNRDQPAEVWPDTDEDS